jgi:hypothetical protein
MIAKTQPKFPFGQIVATPGALEALQKAGQSAKEFLQRHARGDWGEVCEEDRQANDQALLDGSRLLSAYRTSLGAKLWIITEAVDDSGNRAGHDDPTSERILKGTAPSVVDTSCGPIAARRFNDCSALVSSIIASAATTFVGDRLIPPTPISGLKASVRNSTPVHPSLFSHGETLLEAWRPPHYSHVDILPS